MKKDNTKQLPVTQKQFALRADVVDKRFKEVNKRFEQVDKRFDRVDAKFDAVLRRIDDTREELICAIDALALSMERGFAEVYHRLDGKTDKATTTALDKRLTKVEQKIALY